jgi:hypothetical protein
VIIGDCDPDFADGNWHNVRVPLRELYEGLGQYFEPTQALSLVINSTSAEFHKFSLYVDDIAVEPAGPGDEKLTCNPPKIDGDVVDPPPASPSN